MLTLKLSDAQVLSMLQELNNDDKIHFIMSLIGTDNIMKFRLLKELAFDTRQMRKDNPRYQENFLLHADIGNL